MRAWTGALALLLLLLTVPAAGAGDATAPDEATLRAAAAASLPELLQLLSLPNDSIVPADVQRNASWLEDAFRRRGFSTRQLPNGGRPLVLAEYGVPARKALLLYLHFDGQPVIPAEWSQKSAWQPVVKRRGADGRWAEVPTSELLRPDFDPELRLFARSASDDKGPIVMLLAAFDLLRSRKLEPAYGVKVLLDSEEEVGSPGIARVVEESRSLLAADALVIVDGPRHPSGRPTLVFGNRGVVTVTLTVFGPRNPLHSGHFGNYVPNPAFRLARLLSGMKDEEGRVTIPGYYERSKISEVDRRVLAETGDDEPAIWRRVGIASPEKVGGSYQESLQLPSLNVRGLASAGVGEKAANVVPHQAVAELDLRTTVEADADYLVDLLRRHVRAQGYHLVDGEPTDEERRTHPRLARLAVGHATPAARQDMDSPVGRWAYRALEGSGAAEDGSRPVRIRMMGGTVPTHDIVAPLGLPFVVLPLVNPDNNQHTFDENLRMGHYLDGIRALWTLLRSRYDEAPGKP